MNNGIEKLKYEFKKIKELGWVKSCSNGNNGVGLTLENLLGISKNELQIPDYYGIELKAKRSNSESYIILFSSTPSGYFYHEVERIKDTYGYPHKRYPQYKVLNNSVYCNAKTKIGKKFYFQLRLDRKNKKLYLMVYNGDGEFLEDSVYWDFDDLEEKLIRKLNMLALVKAYSKVDGSEYFKYYDMKIYCLKSFDDFINLLEQGIIRVNFKLNIKTKGEKLGKIHDHGTSFDILEKDLNKLYNCYNK